MAAWGQIEEEAPELASRARELLDARTHKTLATLRLDGRPRISGTEAKFVDGDLWFGSMPGARKAADLRRDRRFALHSGSEDPPAWEGDAKLSGLAEEVDGERRVEVFRAMGAEEVSDDSVLFRADVGELSVVRLSEDRKHLVIDVWTEGGGVRSIVRE